jgi:hypothetical protein
MEEEPQSKPTCDKCSSEKATMQANLDAKSAQIEALQIALKEKETATQQLMREKNEMLEYISLLEQY